jgi:arylsulfatase A-like enzyme
VIGGVAACGASPSIDSVILISVDTLRADHIGAYGSATVETPAMDRLAREGIRFTRAIAPAPTTLASHTSLMTGTWMKTHGVASNGYLVSGDNVMLAEILRAAGWRTVAFIGGFPLASHSAFQQGFDEYSYVRGERPNESAAEVTDAALAWLAEPPKGNFFLFVHYWDVHWPYQPPPPFDRKYRSDDLPVSGTKQDIDQTRAALKRGTPDAASLSAALAGLYAGEVSWVDSQIGRLIHALEESGVLDRSLLILTSDHGEAMDEHRWEYWNHGRTVHDVVVRIPLLLRLPGAERHGVVVDDLVSGVDVMPTLLELLGMPVPDAVEGTSFAARLWGEQPARERTYAFSHATKPHSARFAMQAAGIAKGNRDPNAGKCRAVWTSDWKLVECPVRRRIELYDLRIDPRESRDLAASPDPEVQETRIGLQRQLTEWADSGGSARFGGSVPPEAVEKLRALGYLQ